MDTPVSLERSIHPALYGFLWISRGGDVCCLFSVQQNRENNHQIISKVPHWRENCTSKISRGISSPTSHAPHDCCRTLRISLIFLRAENPLKYDMPCHRDSHNEDAGISARISLPAHRECSRRSKRLCHLAGHTLILLSRSNGWLAGCAYAGVRT